MKYKRKLAPATTFDFAAMETWLSDMAEDGWIPVDFRGEKVKFQQAEPQKRSYRIAIPRYFDTQPTAKQLEEYHQLGWEFICTYRSKGYLLANLTEHPDEPYIDPEVQKKNIDALYREERYLYLVGVILFPLLFIGMGLLGWRDLGRNIIDPNLVLEFYGPILFLLLAVFNFYELRLLKRLKTSLEQGLPISHEKDYTKKLQLKRISNLIYAILGITLLLPPLSDIYSAFRPDETQEKAAVSVSPLPYVPMEEITKSASDTEISLYSEPTLFAPLLFQTFEMGDSNSMDTMLLGANGTFPDAFLPSTAEQALVLSSDSFDEGYFYQETSEMQRQMLTLRKGNRLLIVRYHGENRLADSLSAFLPLLEQDYTIQE